jgi:hypothetical protein
MMGSVNSIYTAVKPLLYVSKVSGVAPFSYVSDTRRGTVKLMSRCSDMFWVVVLITCFLMNMPMDLYIKKFQPRNYALKLYIVYGLFQTCHHCASTITVLSLSVFRRSNLHRIFVLLSEVDELMYENTDRQVLYKRTRSLIVLQIIITSAVLGPLIYGYTLRLATSTALQYVSTLIEMVEHLPLICLVLQFINIVLLLRQRYKCLNRMIDSHLHVWRHRRKSFGRNILPLLDTDIFGSSYCNMTSFRRQILEKRHIYSKLYDIVLLVNSCFGLPIFLLTWWIFLHVVLLTYASALYITTGSVEGSDIRECTWTLFAIILCILLIIVLLLIVLSCDLTAEESRKSQILIEKLVLRTDLGYETLNELRALSVQLNNMQVTFSAAGFFSLDLPFMYSFVGAICTYIVILAQFN